MPDANAHRDGPERAGPRFDERPTGWLAEDAYRFAALPLVAGAGLGVLGSAWGAGLGLVLAAAVAAFFRNPARPVPPGEGLVLAPADGRVIQVGEVEGPGGEKRLRVGIFLSVLNVHVNRMPIAGRVTSIERGGTGYRAAFRSEAEDQNVYCRVHLESREGFELSVTQITGWIARRIVCHLRVGEWIDRGTRFGLIRFGSRTDVSLPVGSRLKVSRGDRVQGGTTVLAELPERGGVS